jgi:hypothetical protein
MQLHVGSRHLAADMAVALDATGREHLVIVAKATWSIPDPGQRPRPLPPQPIVLADEYHGAPGESAMRYGTDMARFKPRCDVVFDACAHSPDGQPMRDLQAGFDIAGLRKMVRVLGPRQWRKQLSGWTLSAPEPFIKVPLTAAYALGGTRAYEQDGQQLIEAHLHNPSGLGWAGKQTLKHLDGESAPQLEHPDHPVTRPDTKLPPCALSAVGRHWLPRRHHAGTYDDHWRRDVFPLPPADFDERFHQFAPEDQQMPYPTGGEAVRLINLIPGRPTLAYALPRLDMQVRVLRADYRQEAPKALVDTLFFEPDLRRFSVVWRASIRQLRSIQEFREVAVGPIDPVWWRQRVAGGCAGCSDAPGAGAVAVAGDDKQPAGEAHA